jgi:hypothetical protein
MKRFGLGTNVQAQTKTERLGDMAVPAVGNVVGVSYLRLVDMEANDTTYQVVVSFSTGEFRYGTAALVYITFNNQDALNQFTADMKNAYQHMTSGEKPVLSWVRDGYDLNLLTAWAADRLFIADKRGRSAAVKTKNVAKLIEFLSKINLGTPLTSDR